MLRCFCCAMVLFCAVSIGITKIDNKLKKTSARMLSPMKKFYSLFLICWVLINSAVKFRSIDIPINVNLI